MTYTKEEIHAAVVVAYTRNRNELLELGGIMTDWPLPEDVPAEQWAKDVDYILNDLLTYRVFTWERMTFDDPESPDFDPAVDAEEGVTTRPLGDEAAAASPDVLTYTSRPATAQEIVDFVFSGGMQDEDEGDYWFDQGWNAAKEGRTL